MFPVSSDRSTSPGDRSRSYTVWGSVMWGQIQVLHCMGICYVGTDPGLTLYGDLLVRTDPGLTLYGDLLCELIVGLRFQCCRSNDRSHLFSNI